MARVSSLDAEAWIDAAFTQFARGGLGSVRVEAIARDLETTKGSFYWHFANRKALIDAVMERWERDNTEQYIEFANVGNSPEERLERLFQIVGSNFGHRTGEATLYVEAQREGVEEIVWRVSRRRIAYIAANLEATGLDEAEARNRATLSLAVVLGLQQLTTGTHDQTLRDTAAELGMTALRMALAR